ncbi:hypothetical protein [Streptomyces canus]|nr:hypothetical protein OH824_03500 [Streptomyces canus]
MTPDDTGAAGDVTGDSQRRLDRVQAAAPGRVTLWPWARQAQRARTPA